MEYHASVKMNGLQSHVENRGQIQKSKQHKFIYIKLTSR